jgi:hypothetical protein
MTAALEERLQALETRIKHFEDREAILRTLYDYVHGMEYGRDADAYADLFTEDGVWKGAAVTSTGGAGGLRVEGRKAIRAWFAESGRDDPNWTLNSGPRMNHNIVVVDIRIDGDRADVQSNALITREHPSGPIIFTMGTWNDVLVRCADGRWRFKLRFLQRSGTIPAFQVRAMNTPVGEEKAMMAERWQQDLADAQAKRTANGESR